MPGVSLIGKKAFKNCKIMKLDISGVKKIKEEAFAGGIDTTITLNLPNVTNIGKDAFEGCSIGEMNGLEKLQDKNDLMESGCPVRFFQDDNLSSKIKQLHKKSRDLSDERKDAIYNDYKEFKIACKSFSKPYARCGQMLIRILKEMGEYLPLSNEWAEVIDGNHLGIGSKVKFDDFENEVINPLIKCSNNVMNSENKAQLDDAVEGMKKFQNSLKLYVSEKYVKLIRLNVKEAALSQAYGEYFRVLLSIAGVKKFKKIQGDNLASKTYSSYKLGGGLDLLIGVKEHELESKKN